MQLLVYGRISHKWISHDDFFILNHTKRFAVRHRSINSSNQSTFGLQRGNSLSHIVKSRSVTINQKLPRTSVLCLRSFAIPVVTSSHSGIGDNGKKENSVLPEQHQRETPTPKLGHLVKRIQQIPTFSSLQRSSSNNSQCRKFHTTSTMAVVPSPTMAVPIATAKSPMSSMLNLAGEPDDDIGALSAGFDRRRTLRRKLSTVFDSPPEHDMKQLEKLITQSQHRDSINEESDESDEARFSDEAEKPKDLKVKDVLNQLDRVIDFRGRNISHIIVENAVKELCNVYDFLEETEKLIFLNSLALKGSVDHQSVNKLASSLIECNNENSQLNIQEKLRTALIPKYQWLFSQIGRLEGGVKFLVDFRTDLGEISLKYSDTSLHLKTMNNSLREKIEMWFAVGFLNLERVTWNSPCDMLQKISEYEAVHPMRNWTDLKRRVGNNRRCYVFTHGSMPGEPVVVLHTALTDHIPSNIGYIVTNSRLRMMSVDSNSDLGSSISEDARSITTAIFYSVTSTQKGLAGIELGNYLIKRVVKELQKEFPKIAVFSSLSPIPGFRNWFLAELKRAQHDISSDDVSSEDLKLISQEELKKLASILDSEFNEIDILAKVHSLISHNDWTEDEMLVDVLENIIMRHCARYLVIVKRRGFALNSVANFHLKNGAVVWRINWKANMKPRGVNESCGVMVNYRYFLDDCEKNSQEYMESQVIKSSDQVKHLLRTFSNEASSPISPPPKSENSQ